MQPGILAGGLIAGLAFAALMVFKILPAADHVVKKQYGIYEAMVSTRFCCLCIALPLYVFTFVMGTAILFAASNDKGNALIQQICPDDYSCTESFAMGRQNFNKDACVDLKCSESDLLARAGSQPKYFPSYGLGVDTEPLRMKRTYSCKEISADKGFTCEITSDSEESSVGKKCDCLAFDSALGLCTRLVGCDGDLEKSTEKTTCVERGDFCLKWNVETDSKKQFSLKECSCGVDSLSEAGCDQFSCEELVMEYFYPNVFFAGLTTILFIFPLAAVWYTTLKTQLRKICKCTETEVFVYAQDAGAMDEDRAENLATGGYTEEQKGKSKYRSCGLKDVAVLTVVPLMEAFLGWLVIDVSGRVGAGFIGLAGGLIAAYEIHKYVKMKRNMNADLKERVDRNADQGVNNLA